MQELFGKSDFKIDVGWTQMLMIELVLCGHEVTRIPEHGHSTRCTCPSVALLFFLPCACVVLSYRPLRAPPSDSEIRQSCKTKQDTNELVGVCFPSLGNQRCNLDFICLMYFFGGGNTHRRKKHSNQHQQLFPHKHIKLGHHSSPFPPFFVSSHHILSPSDLYFILLLLCQPSPTGSIVVVHSTPLSHNDHPPHTTTTFSSVPPHSYPYRHNINGHPSPTDLHCAGITHRGQTRPSPAR